jgi:hypothetical protein
MKARNPLSVLFGEPFPWRVAMDKNRMTQGVVSTQRENTTHVVAQRAVVVQEGKIPQKIEQLMNTVRSGLKPNLESATQEELAECTLLLLSIARIDDETRKLLLLQVTEVAVSALLLEKPNIELAKKIRQEVAEKIRSSNRFDIYGSTFGSNSPAGRVVLGLFILFYFGIFLIPILFSSLVLPDEFLGISIPMLMLVGASGAVGSIVSIMVRINQFSDVKVKDQSVLFFTGLFKPIIGMAFAIFIFAILNSGILPVTIQAGKETFFFIALSFIAGFSERFAQDVAIKTEQTIPISAAIIDKIEST